MTTRVWSVFDRDGRLAMSLSNEPGEFIFTRPTDEDTDPVECDFATLQCFQVQVEPELLTLLRGTTSLGEFLESLSAKKYRVMEGRPKPSGFARL